MSTPSADGPQQAQQKLDKVNDANRAARPVDHGHDHAPFFDGLLEDCAGCRRMVATGRGSEYLCGVVGGGCGLHRTPRATGRQQ